MSYLDNSGLSYFWSKIKAALSGKMNKDADLIVKVNPVNATGTGRTGSMKAVAPTYTPSGDIVLTGEQIAVTGEGSTTVAYGVASNTLTIYGFTTAVSISPIIVPSKAKFIGSGAELIVKERS